MNSATSVSSASSALSPLAPKAIGKKRGLGPEERVDSAARRVLSEAEKELNSILKRKSLSISREQLRGLYPEWDAIRDRKGELYELADNILEACSFLEQSSKQSSQACDFSFLSEQLEVLKIKSQVFEQYQISHSFTTSLCPLIDQFQKDIDQPGLKNFDDWKNKATQIKSFCRSIFLKDMNEYMRDDKPKSYVPPSFAADTAAPTPCPSPSLSNIPIVARASSSSPSAASLEERVDNLGMKLFLQRDHMFCDVKFTFRNDEIASAHASVLNARCPGFKDLLLKKYPNAPQTLYNFEIKGCTANQFIPILNAIYTGKPIELTTLNQSLIYYSVSFQLPGLAAIRERSFAHLTASFEQDPNFIFELLTRTSNQSHQVSDPIKDKLLDLKSEQLLTAEGYKKISIQLLQWILENSRVKLSAQNTYLLVCKWLEGQPDDTHFQSKMAKLFAKIKFEEFTLDQFIREVAKTKLHEKYPPLSETQLYHFIKVIYKDAPPPL